MPHLPGIGAGLPGQMGGSSPFFLEQIVGAGLGTDLKMLIDYADGRCWPGSGELFTDLSGLGCNVSNGSSTADTTGNMTFVGTVNGGSKNDYFTQDVATDCARLTTAPQWVADGHKNDAKFTLAGWFYLNGTDGGVRCFFADYAVAVSATRGFGIMHQSGSLIFIVNNATKMSISGVPYDQWVFVLCACNETTGTGLMQINGTQSPFAPGSWSSADTSAATNNLFVGTNSNRTFGLGLNSRQSGYFAWQAELTPAQGLAAWNATKGRFA